MPMNSKLRDLGLRTGQSFREWHKRRNIEALGTSLARRIRGRRKRQRYHLIVKYSHCQLGQFFEESF